MKLYYAAAESGLKDLSAAGVKRILISMANGMRQIPKVPDHFKDGVALLVDSGAFTYAKKGGITISHWIKECKKVERFADEIISLDVIGNPQATYDNYIQIIQDIPGVIPTFHVGSDIDFLYKYLEYTDRIAIGGMVPYKSEINTLKRYLNTIFRCFDPDTLPRFHAFGYFSQDILEAYPFYSADATTWQNYARFGEHHNFIKGQYKRVKSLNVDTNGFEYTSIQDIGILINKNPIYKLKAINKAVNSFEEYLNRLWEIRNATGKNQPQQN